MVDDDAKIVRLVRTYLERDGHTVVDAADGPSALAAIDRYQPSLVVLDLMLPGIDGLGIVEAVRRTDETPIIIVSARGSTSDRIVGLGQGADDYLPKPFSPAELVLRVERLLKRAYGAQAEARAPLLRQGELEVDRERHTVSVGGRAVSVTAVELRLLVALLEADGRVLTRDQLLDAVYRMDDAVYDRTIDVHVKRLREKLGDSAEEPRFIATVRGSGYRSAGRVEIKIVESGS